MLSDSELPRQLKANAPTLSSNMDSASKNSQKNQIKESRDEPLSVDLQIPVLDKDSSRVKGVSNSGAVSSLISGLPGYSHQSLGLTPGALGLPSTRVSSSGLTLPSMTTALLGGGAAAAAAGFGLQASVLGTGLQHTPVLSSCSSSSTTIIPDSSPAFTQPWSLNQHLNITSGSQRLSAFTSLRPSGTLVTSTGSTSGFGQTSTGSSELNKPSSSISPDSGGHSADSAPSATSLQLHPRPTGGPLSFPSPQPASPVGATDHLIRMGGSHTPGVSHPTLSAMYHPRMLGTYPDFPLPPGLPPLCKYIVTFHVRNVIKLFTIRIWSFVIFSGIHVNTQLDKYEILNH